MSALGDQLTEEIDAILALQTGSETAVGTGGDPWAAEYEAFVQAVQTALDDAEPDAHDHGGESLGTATTPVASLITTTANVAQAPQAANDVARKTELDGKSETTHRHDGESLGGTTPLSAIATQVASVGNLRTAGGDGGLSDALSTISDASAANPYTIVLTDDVTETGTIQGRSHVDVDGAGHTLTVDSDGAIDATQFVDVVGTEWRDIDVVRTGAPQSIQIRACTTTTAGGESDRSLRFTNVSWRNEVTSAFDNCYGHVISGDSSPRLRGCEAVGSTGGGDKAYGCAIESTADPLVTDCEFVGGAGSISHGLLLEGVASPTLTNVLARGGDGGTGCSGAFITGLGVATITGSTFRAGVGDRNGNGISIAGNAAPRITNCDIQGYQSSVVEQDYTAANDGRFRPPIDERAVVTSMAILCRDQQPGETVDLGTTIGGAEIAANVPIDTGAWSYFDAALPAELAATDYLYATPSAAVPDGAFEIRYTYLPDLFTSWGLNLTTNGAATIEHSTVRANGSSDPLFINTTATDWRVANCVLETLDPANRYAIGAGQAVSNVPVYDSTLVGGVHPDVASVASGTAVGSNTRT